ASRNGLPMEALIRVMSALLPGILVFTLPISLLVGTLVGLGRLSGDSEIVALGAGGVSRTRMLRPVILIALVISAAMLYGTFNVLPRSVQNLTDLKANQGLIFQTLTTQIKSRVFEESLPKKVLYVEDIDRSQNVWHNILLADLDDEQGVLKIMTASSGLLRQGSRSDMPELYLRKGSIHQINESKAIQQPVADQAAQPAERDEAQRAEGGQPAPAAQTQQERREKRRNRTQESYTSNQFEEMTLGIEVAEEKKPEQDQPEEPRHVAAMTWDELISHTPPPDEIRLWRAEIHKRMSLPAACLVFALLGVAFGISNVRTGRSFGLLLGLAITVTYYLLALSGEHAAVMGRLPVWLGIWLANIILATLGVMVLAAQRRPGADALSVLSSFRHAWRPGRAAESESGARINDGEPRAEAEAILPRRSRWAIFRKIPGAQLIDRLVLADMARFFFFILGGFSILFIIITLFQLLNNIARHNIEWTVVANYLIFLLPMIVNYMTPLSALVAVMVTFGILQKTSQVVALKASGQSIYRMALPAIVASLMLSAVIFLNQDYLLPFTNRRQNNLRYLIRSGQEPPQTFYQTRNQWIFGTDSRIYNYAHFDISTATFARLNVMDLAREPFTITRRLYANRATWDNSRREWVLENGWERRFESERVVFYETFRERRVELPERPEYFQKDSRGPTSMTMNELRNKIADLSRSGFDVLDLKIALQSKLAFPLTCLIMVIVGLPFSFSIGKRGALYGVTLGIAIGLAYWGLSGLFEQMGRYEMLPPVLAAWGANMLFGAGGIYLLLTSRT
ncbi:MAG TPA: LptF/LptG family permease, partial [Blastocatellia bacterium]|nr:LptF/LptG family permease [Blastocatellia bacterium]